MPAVHRVRDDVLERRLHYVTCACGVRLHARRTFEYTDFARKQLVMVAMPAELARWADLEDELRGYMRQAFELGSPLINDLAKGMRGRLVFGQEELREKLVVWTAGFDDAVIECIKVRAFANDPTLGAPRSRLLVDEVMPDDALLCQWFADANDASPARTLELPSAWVHAAERDRESLGHRFPELFGDGFISASRLLVKFEPHHL